MKVKQQSFHSNYADGVHSGDGDWEVRLIDQSDSAEDLRENYFGNMNLTLFSQMVSMSMKWLYFNNDNAYFTSI